jgi:hypothetical protein
VDASFRIVETIREKGGCPMKGLVQYGRYVLSTLTTAVFGLTLN